MFLNEHDLLGKQTPDLNHAVANDPVDEDVVGKDARVLGVGHVGDKTPAPSGGTQVVQSQAARGIQLEEGEPVSRRVLIGVGAGDLLFTDTGPAFVENMPRRHAHPDWNSEGVCACGVDFCVEADKADFFAPHGAQRNGRAQEHQGSAAKAEEGMHGGKSASLR